MGQGSHWSGPLSSGPNKDAGDPNNPFNQALVQIQRSFIIPLSTTGLVTEVAFFIPPSAQISDIIVDVLTVSNAATSSTLSVGNVSSGTQYASGVDVKSAAGRIRPTFTAAQLAAMAGYTTAGVAAPNAGPVFIDITSVGQPSAGVVFITFEILQNPV